MKGAFLATTLALASSAIASPAQLQARQSNSKTPPVEVKGNAFYKKDGTRFYIRGVDYQPGGSSSPKDPIANDANCVRDIKEFKKLGINTVRIYTVDNTKNHDQCMSQLADAGIYLALDVNSGDYSINRKQPKQSYNDVYLQSVFATIDMFQKYDNTLLFFSGNEIINSDDTTKAAPYAKAVQRDMREYIKAHNYRAIPVGYSAADVASNRLQTAHYFNCGGDEQRGDFFAFNNYEWCGMSSFQGSGWSTQTQHFSDYSIPLFLSEYGCNQVPGPRPFNEIEALYGKQMTPVFSGGLVYQYSEEGAKFGLVNLNGQGVTEKKDFQNLMREFQKTPNPQGDGGAKHSSPASECPPPSPQWDISPFQGSDLPAIPSAAKKFMTAKNAGDGPGLSGGSQNAGQTSSGIQKSGTSTSSGSSGSSSSSSGAATPGIVPPFQAGPMMCAVGVIVSSLLGATLL